MPTVIAESQIRRKEKKSLHKVYLHSDLSINVTCRKEDEFSNQSSFLAILFKGICCLTLKHIS